MSLLSEIISMLSEVKSANSTTIVRWAGPEPCVLSLSSGKEGACVILHGVGGNVNYQKLRGTASFSPNQVTHIFMDPNNPRNPPEVSHVDLMLPQHKPEYSVTIGRGVIEINTYDN